jgi:hypothetical protein
MIKMMPFAEVSENATFIYQNIAFKRPDSSNRAIEMEKGDVWEFEAGDQVMSIVKEEYEYYT